ncbi:MAG: hypothetical protein R3C03_23575 [Pirellulaceae bacterium]
MALVIDIADSIVAELNAATLAMPVSAARHYVPSFELQDMNELHVSVVPKGVVVTKSDRNHNTVDAAIDIAVQKKFSVGDAAEIDPLLDLVESIADFFGCDGLHRFREHTGFALNIQRFIPRNTGMS